MGWWAGLLKTFNCGIGMVVIVNAKDADNLTTLFEKHDEIVYRIGTVVKQKGEKVVYK